MLLKKFLFTILLGAASYFSFSQQHNYTFSECIETATDSTYALTRNDIELEKGSYLNKVRNGLWTSKNVKGNIIRKANYNNGLLDGTFETFYFNGKPKATAYFKNGLPTGEWTYFNKKGKIIKKGTYENGKPINQWEITNYKGNKSLSVFDFNSMKELVSSKDTRYNTGTWISQDSQSGEYILVYTAEKNDKLSHTPFGGYGLGSDFFNINFTIPYQLINTYNAFEFTATIHLENSIIKSIEIKEAKIENLNSSSFGLLHYFASTNRKSKLKNEIPSTNTLSFIKDQLKEVIYLAGPWLSNTAEENFTIQIPIVLNNFKKF